MNEVDRSKVLCVGFSHVDRNSLEAMISYHFSADVEEAHSIEEAQNRLSENQYDLILANQSINGDGNEGVELIRALKSDAQFKKAPVMLISNRPDDQAAAVANGAISGFSKAEVSYKRTLKKLNRFLVSKNKG
jgi:CheY-like chemotaxis protein